MFDLFRPGYIRNVNQSFDAVFDFDKRAEVRQITNATAHFVADLKSLADRIPGIRLKLFDSQTDASFVRINVQNLNFDFVIFSDEIFRMLDAFRPGHFRDVNQSFNARFEFDERAVIGDARNFSRNARTYRIKFFDRSPRVGKKLFIAERNFFFFAVEF